MNTTMKITRDWENDGMLNIKDAKTIDRYCELQDEVTNMDFPDTFWAFSDKQFEEGRARLRKHIKAEDKILKVKDINGVYGTKEGLKNMFKTYENLDERIRKECDPQEVYVYEYNNHECCVSWDGDLPAYAIVERIWGKEVASKIKRY